VNPHPPYRAFANRPEAGVELASHLRTYAGRKDVIVLALPRAGVPVAFEIAERLDAPLDIFLVRKLGMPGHPEFAMGAIASGGVRVLSEGVIRWYAVPEREVDALTRQGLANARYCREPRKPTSDQEW
jgi:putative phosphoribosyl transferase